MSLAEVAYRIATDASFADRAQHELQAALAAAHLTLNPDEIRAVQVVLRDRQRWIDRCSLAKPLPQEPQWWPDQPRPGQVRDGQRSTGKHPLAMAGAGL